MPDNDTIDTKSQLAWYHCGRCGSLFQSVTNMSKNRRCSECGFSPNPPATEKNSHTSQFSKSVDSVQKSDRHSHGQIRKTLTRKKTNPFMMRLVLIWVLATGLIVFAIKTIWHEEPTQKPESTINIADAASENENLFLVHKSMGQCIRTMREFLQAGPPEHRSQFVMQPIKAVARMTRHQDIENLTAVSPPTPESSQWNVVDIGEEKAIEVVWANADGRRFDAIFRKETDGWLIDWENFTRYSDMPLSAFLSGDGDAEAEFRLLARERLSEERKNMPTMSIMFYAPVFGRPAETEMSSSEFLIERNSTEGVLLEAAFSALKNKKRPFNAKLANYDPDGMIRVRVKIRRSGEMDTRAFKIVELKACHWYSSDLSGFDVGKEGGVKNQD
jgi:hypothetical protein